MEARQKALEGDWAVPQLGASRTEVGTVNAAQVSYYQASAFRDGLAESSQKTGRMAPMLHHGLTGCGVPVICIESRQPVRR
jgi:hypothetical protein